ncbi:MAG TPA: hypothetical protein PKA59_04255 [Chakrabartia sp.]|nr:hypothetical protein [Chakrabartia sp.]
MSGAFLLLAAAAASPLPSALPAGVQAVGVARVRIISGVAIQASRPLPAGAVRGKRGTVDFQ